MKKIEIEVPEGKRAEWINGVLTLVDEKPTDVRERVKTYEDACEVLGISPVLNCQNLCICEKHEETGEMHEHFSFRQAIDKQTLAYLKLCVITATLNEGWKPQFTEDEYRYIPWFYLYTQKEIDKMSEENKSRVVFRSNNSAFAHGGVAYAYTGSGSSNAGTHIGSRLVFKTRELAEYAGKQFTEIYADFNFKSE